MSKATQASTTSRRAMLAGLATLSMTGSVHSATVLPDAELIKACQKFDDYERQYVAIFDNPAFADDDDLSDAECARIDAAREPLLHTICSFNALTPEGHQARARTLSLYAVDLLKPRVLSDHLGPVPARMLQALLRDLTCGVLS